MTAISESEAASDPVELGMSEERRSERTMQLVCATSPRQFELRFRGTRRFDALAPITFVIGTCLTPQGVSATVAVGGHQRISEW